MKTPIVWVVFYCLLIAVSQVLLKTGTNQLGHFVIRNQQEALSLIINVARNPYIIGGIVLMVASFFLWIYILSWFDLGLVFPLTAILYVFVAWMSFFVLGEKLNLFNYLGMLLIAAGIFFLLWK